MGKKECGVYESIINRALEIKHPLDVIWELTYRCNEKCEHCYVLQTDRNELSKERCMKILQELADAGVLFITFTGGEPFLREDIFDLISEARRLKFAVTIFTNGTLLGLEECKWLSKKNLRSMEISLYGSKPETHDSITGVQGSFHSTIRAVECLIENGVRVVLKMIVMRKNVNELGELVRYAQECNVRFRWSSVLTPRNDGDVSFMKDMRLSDNELRTITEREFSLDEEPSPDLLLKAFDDLENKIPCSAGHTTCGILPDGTVLACPQFVQGTNNLKDSGFLEIWNESTHFKAIRNITESNLPECETCAAKFFCFRCQAHALLEDGNLLGPSRESCREAFLKLELYESKTKIPATQD
ncbi:MAG: radical SAM protein [Calditrichaeota bacterium]|nr:radical SAM protein [Calditrichota bacterium]